MKCPVCGAAYLSSAPPTYTCRRCGVDLSPLIHLYDRALWHHRQAIEAFRSGDDETALAENRQALSLSAKNAEFQALAGQLRALQGDFPAAVQAWKKAQQLHPPAPIAGDCLQTLRDLSRPEQPDRD